MTRILIITSGPLCENPRPLKEARLLSERGHDVTVLSVRTHAATEALDRGIVAAERFKRVALDVIPGYGTAPALVWLRQQRVRVGRRLAAAGVATPAALGHSGPLLQHARGLPADLTIVHNEAPHWVGTRLIREGRRVAADIEDWHSEDLQPADRKGRPLSLLRANERFLLRNAAYCSTTSHALADALHERYGGSRARVVFNAFPLQPAPPVRDGTVPTFFWFSQTIGPGRGLEEFVAAWSRSKIPTRLVLLGQSRPSFCDAMLAALPPAKRELVQLHPTVSPGELPTIIARHDVGLALENAAIPSRNLTITNKILQYFNAGVGVLATGTAGQREALAHAPDAGLLADLSNASALAAQIDLLGADAARIRRMGTAARRAAETIFCWEMCSPVLLQAVQDALDGVRPALGARRRPAT